MLNSYIDQVFAINDILTLLLMWVNPLVHDAIQLKVTMDTIY